MASQMSQVTELIDSNSVRAVFEVPFTCDRAEMGVVMSFEAECSFNCWWHGGDVFFRESPIKPNDLHSGFSGSGNGMGQECIACQVPSAARSAERFREEEILHINDHQSSLCRVDGDRCCRGLDTERRSRSRRRRTRWVRKIKSISGGVLPEVVWMADDSSSMRSICHPDDHARECYTKELMIALLIPSCQCQCMQLQVNGHREPCENRGVLRVPNKQPIFRVL